ncbi:EAP30/Vps36 family-domain-containing protein [Melampsora americana]|nr:EAP30/Vps36 family-domain-containing protein [Melampsora americana]
MHRLRPIDTSNQTIKAQLFPEERIIEHQIGVGLYDGKEKDDNRTDGDLYLTSFRLIYIDTINPKLHSTFLELKFIRQTEYWIGFLKSSPKITLLLTESNHSSTSFDKISQSTQSNHSIQDSATTNWTCSVCGFSNLASHQCGLCGIPRPSSHNLPSRSTLSASNNRSVSANQSSTNALPRNLRATSMYNLNQQADWPASQSQPTQQTCPTCTFINHSSMTRCEMCDSTLKPGKSSTPNDKLLTRQLSTNSLTNENQTQLQHSRATTPGPPASFPSNSYIRLSFRKGGDKVFYNALKTTLQNKAWLTDYEVSLRSSSNQMNGVEGNMKAIGIDGIMRSMDSKLLADQTELNEGLKDLEALMTKAKEMVQMAQVLNSKLTALESQTNQTEPNDQRNLTIVRSSLLKLGLPTPAITSDMMENDESYEIELTKELAGLLSRELDGDRSVLIDGKVGSRGIVSLDEVWCIWNRARGVGALISPKEFLLACQRLPQYTDPVISLSTFKSGLKVIHTDHYSSTSFGKRLRNLLEENQSGIQTYEIAQSEGISISLTYELIQCIELDHGSVVRDCDDRNQVYWYANLIDGYHWNDPNFV